MSGKSGTRVNSKGTWEKYATKFRRECEAYENIRESTRRLANGAALVLAFCKIRITENSERPSAHAFDNRSILGENEWENGESDTRMRQTWKIFDDFSLKNCRLDRVYHQQLSTSCQSGAFLWRIHGGENCSRMVSQFRQQFSRSDENSTRSKHLPDFLSSTTYP